MNNPIRIGIGLVLILALLAGAYLFFTYEPVDPNYHPELSGISPAPAQPSVSTDTTYPTSPKKLVVSTSGGVTGQNIAPSLTAPTWTWQYTTNSNGTRTTPKDPSRFALKLETNGTIKSSTDCNSISSTYTTQGTGITFTPFMATMMFCSDASQEGIYSSQLSSAQSYSLISNELHLTLKDGSVMVFTYHLGINE